MTDLNRYYTVKGKGKNKKVVRKEIPKGDKEVPTVFGSKPPEENQKSKCEILPEPLNEKEPEKLRNGIMKHPAFVLYEWPEVPEISKQENPVAAWLVEATAYIALHLQAHNCFRLEISNENLKSLKLIHQTFIDIQNHLPSVLPNYENRYNQVYKPFQETLQNFDSIADTPAKRAGIFLGQVKDFLDLVLTIHSETLRKYGKVAQTSASSDNQSEPPRIDETATLVLFMQKYCDYEKGCDIESKKVMLYKHNRNPVSQIKLPTLAKQWKSGESKIYYVDELKQVWPALCSALPTLPPLKKS